MAIGTGRGSALGYAVRVEAGGRSRGRDRGVEGFKGQGPECKKGVRVGNKMVMGTQNWVKRPGYTEE